jgi:hypothetical protein
MVDLARLKMDSRLRGNDENERLSTYWMVTQNAYYSELKRHFYAAMFRRT